MAGGAKSNAPDQIEEALLTGEMLVPLLFFALLALGFFYVAGMTIVSQRRIREMEHRERLAMIERGLIPSPELDPGLFERRTGMDSGPESPVASRSRSIGVLLMGMGLGLTIMISFAGGAPSTGIGIGGAIAVLGAAFYVNGTLTRRDDARRPPTSAIRSPSPERHDPPSNPAP